MSLASLARSGAILLHHKPQEMNWLSKYEVGPHKSRTINQNEPPFPQFMPSPSTDVSTDFFF